MADTGYLVRIMRDGKPVNIDISAMTDQELDDYCRTKKPEFIESLAKSLAIWIRENVILHEEPEE